MRNRVIVNTSRTMSTTDMQVGDLAVVTSSLINEKRIIGHVILKMSESGFVSLTDTSKVWYGDAELVVEILPKGTVINLTVGGDTE
jgi:hypothetical protein